MTLIGRACSVALACACAVAGLAGCSSGPPDPFVTCSLPPWHAHGLDVTMAGRVRWQVPLAAPRGIQEPAPLAVGPVAVFAEDGVLSGLRLADGRRVWSRAGNQDIARMWRWQGLVVVLTWPGPNGAPPALLTGLDASTGQVRWTQRVDGSVDGLSPTADGGLAATADGGLAIINGAGVLEVVDLTSGRVRWTRPPGPGTETVSPAMAAAGGALVVMEDGRLASYDDQTGHLRWADTLESAPQYAAGVAEQGLQVAAGLVYLTGVQGGEQVLGISAADGRVTWRFGPRAGVALAAYAPGLVSVLSGTGGQWQDEIDPATGQVRWQVATPFHATVTPAGVVFGPTGDGVAQVSLRDTLTGQVQWTASSSTPPVLPAGPLLITQAADPDSPYLLAALRMSDGHRAWQVTIPEPPQAPLSAAPGGILVYTATTPAYC